MVQVDSRHSVVYELSSHTRHHDKPELGEVEASVSVCAEAYYKEEEDREKGQKAREKMKERKSNWRRREWYPRSLCYVLYRLLYIYVYKYALYTGDFTWPVAQGMKRLPDPALFMLTLPQSISFPKVKHKEEVVKEMEER